MRLFTKLLSITAFSLTASLANAAIVQFDGFDDTSSAASSNATPINSDTVADSNGNDLFTTRQIKLSSTNANQGANIQANDSIPGALAYSAETSVLTDYEILYSFSTPTDLTLGKGAAGPNDFFEMFVQATDFPATFDVRINGAAAYTNLGTIPAGIGSTSAPGIVAFNLSDFPSGISSVTSIEFRIIPRNFLGNRAAAADGEFDFFQLNVEQAAVVPVPSAILMLVAGLIGVRRFSKAA